MFLCFGLAACSNAPVPAVPFMAGLPDQMAVMEFRVVKTDPYRLYLQVNWPAEGEGEGAREVWREETGDINKVFTGRAAWGGWRWRYLAAACTSL